MIGWRLTLSHQSTDLQITLDFKCRQFTVSFFATKRCTEPVCLCLQAGQSKWHEGTKFHKYIFLFKCSLESLCPYLTVCGFLASSLSYFLPPSDALSQSACAYRQASRSGTKTLSFTNLFYSFNVT